MINVIADPNKSLIALHQPLDLPGVPERASPHPGLPNDDTLQKRPNSEARFQTSDVGNALSRTDCLQDLIQCSSTGSGS